MKLALLVMAAGAAGTLSRFLAFRFLDDVFGKNLPYSTWIVNTCGSFAAGLIFVLVRQRFEAAVPYLPVLMIGFLGAFTTFSTFALESANFLVSGDYGKAVCHILLQNGIGVLAAFAGIFCAKALIA